MNSRTQCIILWWVGDLPVGKIWTKQAQANYSITKPWILLCWIFSIYLLSFWVTVLMISLVLNQKYILFCSKYSIERLEKKSVSGFAPDKASSGRTLAQSKCTKNETQFGTNFRKTPVSWVTKTTEVNGLVEFTQINSGMNLNLR